MDFYYQPASDVIEGRVGRLLHDSEGYHGYVDQLEPGEHLYLAAFNGAWWVVVWVFSEEEYRRTYGHPESKTGLRFYALPQAARDTVPK